jgi:hypothetical protein
MDVRGCDRITAAVTAARIKRTQSETGDGKVLARR